MVKHTSINITDLWQLIRQDEIRFGGNEKLKIYGTLKCKSGRRVKKKNRVFFSSETEAIKEGYRPCGHCMKQAYLEWKAAHLTTGVS